MSQFDDNYTIQERLDADNCFYNTLGTDTLLLGRFHRRQVWSIIENEDKIYVAPGMNHPNKTLYLVTVEGWNRRDEVYQLN